MANYNVMIAVAARELAKWKEDVLTDLVGEKIERIISQHALGAAAAGLGVAWIPGAGGAAAMAAMVGFIWSMYFRINSCLNLKLSKVLVKSIASAMLSNIAGSALSVAGGIAASTVLSFIPGLGTGISELIMAGIDYAVVATSGVIYLNMLTGLFKAGYNPENMTETQFKEVLRFTVESSDVEKMVKEAKAEYTEARKSGKVDGKETVKLVIEEVEDVCCETT